MHMWHVMREREGITFCAYLSVKNAFSVRPLQQVATAMTKVVIPKVEWMGTRLALKEAVADSQQSNSKKLKNPTMNWKKTTWKWILSSSCISSK